MANFQMSESVEINRPAGAVFHYVADVSQAPEWRPSVSVRDFSGEPMVVGSSWSEVTKFMGRDMVVNMEVTGLEENRQCSLRMDGGVVSGNMTWDFNPGTDDSSTFALSFDGEVTGWLASLASGLIRNQAQKDMKRDLANLKAKLESS
jgi:carbon monoxide dehydrogenase subunit G